MITCTSRTFSSAARASPDAASRVFRRPPKTSASHRRLKPLDTTDVSNGGRPCDNPPRTLLIALLLLISGNSDELLPFRAALASASRACALRTSRFARPARSINRSRIGSPNSFHHGASLPCAAHPAETVSTNPRIVRIFAPLLRLDHDV